VACLVCVAGMFAHCSGETNGQSAPGASALARAAILFVHHSTGECVWNGGVAAWFSAYNAANQTQYAITEQAFPKDEPYGWNNYPYDYWNIWVRHAGARAYQGEPTLEMLTPTYDVIVFKHCFPVSAIEADTGRADVADEEKRVENYKLQYAALKKKLRAFPKTKFILWTGAALIESETDEAAARRAKAFFGWVRTAWDEPGDNIFIWDFHTLETGGRLYLKTAHASGDSHPNETFSRRVAPLFGRRIVDVIRGAGDTASVTGEGGESVALATPAEPAPEPPAAPKVEPPAPPVMVTPGPDAWVLDNAEDAKRAATLWGAGAAYAADGDGRVITVRFAEGREEDWGEYGVQRIVMTKRPAKSHDISAYRYVAFRVKVDRAMEVVFTLVTKPDSLSATDESYFGFTAYLHPKPGAWQWVAIDLTKCELAAEGDRAYALAGKPTRPQRLTMLKLVTNKKNEAADVALDDITFHKALPKALTGKVVAP